MFCMKCGTELPEGASFCYNCGLTVKRPSQVVPQQRQPIKKSEPAPTSHREYPRPVSHPQPEIQRRPSGTGKYSKQEENVSTSIGSILWGFIKAVAKGFLLALLAIVILKTLDPYDNIIGIDQMREAYQYAQEVIADQLPMPDTAEFPEFDPDLIQRNGELTVDGYEYNSYLIYSYMTGKNESGRSGRYEYQIVIGLPNDSENDNFYYEILELK